MRESFDIGFLLESIPLICKAIPVTLIVMLASIFFGWGLGLLISSGKIFGPNPLRRALDILTDIFRGIPTIVLLFLVYFGLPVVIELFTGGTRIGLNKLFYVAFALALEIGVYTSEMLKSAYDSLDVGQTEAAYALGLSRWALFWRVLLPQMVRVIIPNLGNSVLAAMQGSALVFTLGVFDILGRARQIDSMVFYTESFELYVFVAILYWVIALIIDFIFKIIEKRFAWGKGVQEVWF